MNRHEPIVEATGQSHKEENLYDLSVKVKNAMIEGYTGFVETTKENIDRIMRGKKWDPPGYITYEGAKVCAYGTTQRIEEEERVALGQRLMGTKEALESSSQSQKSPAP